MFLKNAVGNNSGVRLWKTEKMKKVMRKAARYAVLEQL